MGWYFLRYQHRPFYSYTSGISPFLVRSTPSKHSNYDEN